MHTTVIWNKQHIFCKKIIILVISLLGFSGLTKVEAQHNKEINLPNYEDKKMQYGFFVGLHSSTFRMSYAPAFTTSEYERLESVMIKNTPGFSLGFVVNHHFLQFLDLRLLPKAGFYGWEVEYNYDVDDFPKEKMQALEAVFVELPLMLKYKSVRRGNSRLYLIGGLTPSFEATGRKEHIEEKLQTRSFNLAVEYGFGIDIFYPLFKFAPEIRFSHGLVNMNNQADTFYNRPIKSFYTHSVSLYLHFEGGR